MESNYDNYKVLHYLLLLLANGEALKGELVTNLNHIKTDTAYVPNFLYECSSINRTNGNEFNVVL